MSVRLSILLHLPFALYIAEYKYPLLSSTLDAQGLRAFRPVLASLRILFLLLSLGAPVALEVRVVLVTQPGHAVLGDQAILACQLIQ